MAAPGGAEMMRMPGMAGMPMMGGAAGMGGMPMGGAAGMGGMPMMGGGAPGMGMAGYPYTPEQMAWMQQMYSQYMAQYMQ